jgi:hypothetical protein
MKTGKLTVTSNEAQVITLQDYPDFAPANGVADRPWHTSDEVRRLLPAGGRLLGRWQRGTCPPPGLINLLGFGSPVLTAVMTFGEIVCSKSAGMVDNCASSTPA